MPLKGEKVSAGKTTVIDPRGRVHEEVIVKPERLRSLDGKTVGIILEGPWRSWYVMADRISSILEEQDIRTKQISLGQTLMDTSDFSAERSARDDSDALDAFASQVDTVIVGMGN